MKVGIITIHNSPNYGACLQSFALYKYIEMLGCDVEIIDLHRPYAYADYVPSKKYTCSRPVKTTWKQKLKQSIKSSMGVKEKHASLYSSTAVRKFEEFNSSVKLSRPYRCIDDLYADPPLYDLYISGSDQLWNPTQAYCLEPYFLTFVPKGQGKKISYATSIGITELRDNEKRDFGKWLSPYECISVRESQAKALLEAILPHKEIYQVADPTFLLSRNVWQKLAIQPSTCNPYILLFTLRHEPILLDYCKKLSKESGLQLIELGQVQPEVENDEYVAVKDAGPKEFLGYIGNAELVITDSFHCTVFSLIMRAKNFYTYIAPTNNRGSRIIDLLDIYGLKNHLLGRDLKKSFKELMTDKIDTVAVGCKMETERLHAQGFLNKCLK